MKIAIIEKGHFEVAFTLISLFDRDDNTITIFIDESTYNQLSFLLNGKITHYTWVVQSNESNRSFIKSMFEKIDKDSFDILYFNTIADNFINYAWHLSKIKQTRTVLTLHDVNGFFHYSPSFSIRRVTRYFGKRKLIKIIPCFNVLSETMVPHLKQKLPPTKQILNIPGGLFFPESFVRKEFNKNDTIKITIPGSIDIRRRNYSLLFEFLQSANARNIPVSITLLGGFRKNHSELIYSQCQDYLKKKDNLHIYNSEIVNQDEFDKVMNESHFIWMPLQSTAIVTDGTVEKYGASITSGNIGDAIRYGRPFFAPRYFKFDESLQKSCLKYENIEDILTFLEKLDSRTYESYLSEAVQASMNYTKDKIIERNNSLFH
ncbi:MAG: hypothetical protein ABUT20_30465 [Bacteroidota bacterium]